MRNRSETQLFLNNLLMLHKNLNLVREKRSFFLHLIETGKEQKATPKAFVKGEN